MHELLSVADFIFEEWTDESTPKDIGNEFWYFCKSKFLDDTTHKIKVVDFVYDHILHLNTKYYKEKYNINLDNVKKTKDQITFVAEIVTKLIKYSDIPLVDY